MHAFSDVWVGSSYIFKFIRDAMFAGGVWKLFDLYSFVFMAFVSKVNVIMLTF